MTSSPAPDLEELERLAKAATPGPWELERYDDGWLVNGTGDYDGLIVADYSIPDRDYDHAADAAYIAAASPAVILALITELRAAREAAAESGRLREALRLLQDGMRSAGPGGSLAIDHSSWRERATKFLATPPAPSDHGAGERLRDLREHLIHAHDTSMTYCGFDGCPLDARPYLEARRSGEHGDTERQP